ncbi:fungal-specific transcription factor domain-containing protein [Boeremia exigua]|uniref:fungal-specific transcription factor domain-containing protein n=1 Tax=Boeremia exigua TaxID=749465 RepID=UPI001E8DCDE5|nr:fungal-specific transcription factor domain-containing protein [Boeremia exigua]KAH6619015.1 fungal-specific transcription factor domain-containing protein [Boeremia exigua]
MCLIPVGENIALLGWMAPAIPERRASFQPFQCQICQSRFTRHENLKRHAAVHTRSSAVSSLVCEFCAASFSRSDLRQRHIKRKHPEHQTDRPRKRQMLQRDKTSSTSPPQIQDHLSFVTTEEQEEFNVDRAWKNAIQYDQRSPGLDQRDPRNSGSSRNDSAICTMSVAPPAISDHDFHGQAKLGSDPMMEVAESQLSQGNTAFSGLVPFTRGSPNSWFSVESPQVQEDWTVSTRQAARGTELFFNHLSSFLPFIHQPTFNADKADKRLLLGMMSLGYQYGEDPEYGEQAGSGASLSYQCFHQARALLKTDIEDGELSTSENTIVVQACLLQQLYTMMYLCGSASAYGLKTHSKIISLARAGGLMQPLTTEATATANLESLWYHFIQSEAHKRTCFAVHQIDALWYQVLSVPRSLSHLEIKHELPCPEDHWAAATPEEWAHRQLLLRQAGTAVQYPEVVRRFLSSNADLCTLPPFDPYGTINITQFLISSAREISGWSTITGILSIERVEPLRSSLVALEPFTRPHGGTSNPALASLGEIAWETAMIELQMWSPTHTGGIIQGSVDAVLDQLTEHAPSCEFLCESRIINLVQPHVDWFLQYLDATATADTEAPWVVLYAYKAFMIAWQLVRNGIVGSMQVVDVPDGDTHAALAWARKVFGRRQRWQLGKIVMRCIDQLEVGTSLG